MILSAPNHNGEPRLPSDVLPKPPREIADVLSATTTATTDSHKAKIGFESTMVGFCEGLIFALVCSSGWNLIFNGHLDYFTRESYVVAGVTFVIGAYVSIKTFKGKGKCTIVGLRGIATVNRVHGIKWNKPEVVMFADAREVHKEFVRFSDETGYYRTEFRFEWFDENRRRIWQIAGLFVEFDGEITSPDLNLEPIKRLEKDHHLHFALAAEKAWRDFTGRETVYSFRTVE
jgi:hypothetical protein